MYRVSIVGEQAPFADMQQFAMLYPDLVLDAAARRIVPRGNRLVQQQLVDSEPPPRKKGDKVRWTTEKQRRAFFATDGFGHGIPYRRTGNLARAWQFVVDVTDNGLTASVRNDAPAAPFVYGRWQQGFHADQGWPLARPIVDTIANQLRPILVDLPDEVRRSFARGYP